MASCDVLQGGGRNQRTKGQPGHKMHWSCLAALATSRCDDDVRAVRVDGAGAGRACSHRVLGRCCIAFRPWRAVKRHPSYLSAECSTCPLTFYPPLPSCPHMHRYHCGGVHSALFSARWLLFAQGLVGDVRSPFHLRRWPPGAPPPPCAVFSCFPCLSNLEGGGGGHC